MPEPEPTPAWASEPVALATADPTWPAAAERYIAEVHQLLGPWLLGAPAHVGSTAVPGLVAKPIIDLQAIAADPAAAIADRRLALAEASWFCVPRELDQRPWRWFTVRADPVGQHRLAHLHLMAPGEPRLEQQLTFRDRLRASPALAQEYAQLKTGAATTHQRDREAYSRAKAAFVRRVLND